MAVTAARQDSDGAAREGVTAALLPAHGRSPMRRYVRDLYLVDVVAASLAASVAHVVRFGFDDASLQFWARAVPYGLLSVILVAAWVGLQWLGGSYGERVVGFGADEYRRVGEVGLRLVALVAIVAFAFDLNLARGFVASLIPLTVVFTLVGRWWSRRWLHRHREAGTFTFDVLAVGSPKGRRDMADVLRSSPQAGYHLAATLDVSSADEHQQIVAVLNEVAATGVHAVAVTSDAGLSPKNMRFLAWRLSNLDVQLLVSPGLSDLVAPRVSIKPVAGAPLLHLEQPGLSGGARFLKATIDRTAALVGIILLAPVLGLLALAVRLTSPGPVFFTQLRLGQGGRWFRIYKFRTMRVDAPVAAAEENEVGGLFFKMRHDPRITPLGHTLRRLSLDELPQIWNVLKGDMSLVGPRPLPDAGDSDDLEAAAQRRVVVKPGLTGLWQINGRSDLSWDESIRHDLHYVENWSLALDVVILLKTAAAVLRGKGAY